MIEIIYYMILFAISIAAIIGYIQGMTYTSLIYWGIICVMISTMFLFVSIFVANTFTATQ